MMTKKTMTILSVFMIVALTAVGFAAWLIVGTIDAETTGSFVSNELEDKYFKVEVDFDTTTDKENGQIIYGRPSTAYDSTRDSWLSYSNKDKVEHLTSTATVKFIPDDGFFKNDTKPEENRDMKYYLEEVIEKADGSIEKTQYRTVRVIIDIAEILDPATDNYKWFDMAVELGYIQYPTAYVVQKDSSGVAVPGQNYESATHKLQWYTNDSATTAEKALVALEDNDYTKFQNGVLAIDLDYSQFFVDYGTGNTAEFATADIQIDFAWGKAMKLVEDEKEVFANPYKFFDTVKPEDAVEVAKYFDATTKTLIATQVNTQDPDKPGVEDYDEVDAKTIRCKDLAQRMLDYLRDYVNYVPADAEATPPVKESGIQFSITLLEGEPDAE